MESEGACSLVAAALHVRSERGSIREADAVAPLTRGLIPIRPTIRFELGYQRRNRDRDRLPGENHLSYPLARLWTMRVRYRNMATLDSDYALYVATRRDALQLVPWF